MTMTIPEPSPAERKALFRLGLVGDLLARDLARGELEAELKGRSARPCFPPGARTARRYHWKTLESWYYDARRDGLAGLVPRSRRRGHATALDDEARAFLVDVRREHPSAPAELILTEAVRHKAVAPGAIALPTLRRLLADHGATRSALQRPDRARRRWATGAVGKLWHGDVCHLWVKDADNTASKVYVHALLDDHARYVVALEARVHEAEVDMLSVLCTALLSQPTPTALYLDNGACYRGEVLALACGRLGIRLVHAGPYDPEARGKMERFWRTLRQRCTDHLAPGASLAAINTALVGFLDGDYHVRPHAGLLGKAPLKLFDDGLRSLGRPRTAAELATALEVHLTRKIRKDLTFSLDGRTYEVAGRHHAGATLTVVLDPFDRHPLRAQIGDQPVTFAVCDPLANAHRSRVEAEAPPPTPTRSFDPIAGLLRRAREGSNG